MIRLFKIAALLMVCACISLCSACIPPFINGAVEAPDYFDETVTCDTYAINPNADGGYDTIVSDDLSLTKLTDNDENNIDMRYYLSFKFTVKQETTLKNLAFIVEVEENAELRFQLSYGTLTSTKSINLSKKKKDILQFDGLELELASSDDLIVTLDNPIISQVKYRIDTLIFII